MTDFPFKLELPKNRPYYSAALVAQLTTHAIWPENVSVETIIERIDQLANAAEGENFEVVLPKSLTKYIQKLVNKKIDHEHIATPNLPRKAKNEAMNRFVVASEHFDYLCAMYRKGEVAFLNPQSNIPVDSKIPDFNLKNAQLTYADFVKFANSLGVDVLLSTPPKKIADSTPVKALSSKERTTLLKLVGGLAQIGAELNIHSPRINGIKETVGDLALKGVVVDEDTLRKYLKAAAELMSKPNSV